MFKKDINKYMSNRYGVFIEFDNNNDFKEVLKYLMDNKYSLSPGNNIPDKNIIYIAAGSKSIGLWSNDDTHVKSFRTSNNYTFYNYSDIKLGESFNIEEIINNLNKLEDKLK